MESGAGPFKDTELGSIPSDWNLFPLGELFDVQQGKALSPSAKKGIRPRPFLRTANVLWSRLDLRSVDWMDFSAEEAEKLSLLPGDLLVCEGGEIGRTAIWSGGIEECSYQNHIHRLRRKSFSAIPEFVMYWMQAAFLSMGLYGGIGNRTTIPNLSGARLKRIVVAVPPTTDEQRSMVSILSTIQKTALIQERIVAKLKELKAATRAKLFREGLRGEPLKETGIGEIPRSWAVRSMGDILLSATYGLSMRGAGEGRYPILRMNCQQDGEVVFRDLQYVDLDDHLFGRFRLAEGDILFNRTNSHDLVGRTAIYRGAREATFASYLIRLRVDDSVILPAFLNCYLNLAHTQQSLKSLASRGVSQSNISASKLRGFAVPVPPRMDEQREIVRMVDQLSQACVLGSGRREQSQAVFSSLLHLLMTGKVRIRVRP